MEISKWLIHDEQKELFEILVAGILNVVFLALISLLLWPLGRLGLLFRLTQGYAILWVVIYLTFLPLYQLQRVFRVNVDEHPNAFVVSNLAVSCFLQAGWSAFAALTIHGFVAGERPWLVGIVYLTGVLSCLIAFLAVSSFYQGHIYKLISLPVALVSFIVFSGSPASARLTYGWFFDLF